MADRKPVAWLHCEQPNAHVITDDIKKLWGEVNPQKVQKYTIPVYRDVVEKANVKNELEIFQGWQFDSVDDPFTIPFDNEGGEGDEILIRQPDGNCTIVSQEEWQPRHLPINVLHRMAKMLKDAKQ